MAERFLITVFEALPVALACRTFAALCALFLVVLIYEWHAGGKIRRYLEASFRTDLVYTMLIIGGVYSLLQQPLISWLDSNLRQLALFVYRNLLDGFSDPVRLVIFLIAVDFCRYWKHRWMHSVPALRAIHSIHHEPASLNLLTTYRIHIVEYLIDGVVTLVPVVLLGIPPQMWLTFYLVLVLYSALAHSDLNLSFGVLDRVFVSPRFHATHHSARKDEYDTNFGSLLSVWDILFGSARFISSRPRAYGLSNLSMPQSFFGQLLFPAKVIFGLKRKRARSRPGEDNYLATSAPATEAIPTDDPDHPPMIPAGLAANSHNSSGGMPDMTAPPAVREPARGRTLRGWTL